jgi:hypothetical protein
LKYLDDFKFLDQSLHEFLDQFLEEEEEISG